MPRSWWTCGWWRGNGGQRTASPLRLLSASVYQPAYQLARFSTTSHQSSSLDYFLAQYPGGSIRSASPCRTTRSTTCSSKVPTRRTAPPGFTFVSWEGRSQSAGGHHHLPPTVSQCLLRRGSRGPHLRLCPGSTAARGHSLTGGTAGSCISGRRRIHYRGWNGDPPLSISPRTRTRQ